METNENKSVANNTQINNTDYYKLKCGKYLEDFIWACNLNFAWGSALKYLFRAGHKDGEGFSKDVEKARHYISFLALHTSMSEREWGTILNDTLRSAREWDGKIKPFDGKSLYNKRIHEFDETVEEDEHKGDEDGK